MRVGSWQGLTIPFVLLSLAVAGCGGPQLPNPVKVTGTVKLDGKPLADTTIVFHCVGTELPGEARTSKAKTGADGTYTLEKCYPASYKVGFEGAAPMANPDPAKMGAMPAASPIAKYDLSVSKLTADVTDGSEPINFDLK
jgi:hypothetical protein